MQKSRQSPKSHPPAAPAIDHPGHAETVLVVDDEYSVCRLVKQALELSGYKVLTAGDGKQALTQYVGNRAAVAVALVDLLMPGMDGAATIRALRHINPHLKIVAGTSPGHEPEPDLLASLHVSHSLPKPYRQEILLQKLREVLAADPPPPGLTPSPTPASEPPP